MSDWFVFSYLNFEVDFVDDETGDMKEITEQVLSIYWDFSDATEFPGEDFQIILYPKNSKDECCYRVVKK